MEDSYEQKYHILEQENDLLEKIAEAQEAVRNAVTKREWADFESMIALMNGYQEQFDALETERVSLFSTFSSTQDAEGKTPHFYRLVASLPEAERIGLTTMYRKMKARALKVRTANEALLLYLTEAKATVNGFMEAAFPNRKDGVYSRKGTKVSADMRSIVLDQTF
jgi:hypothetical protein